MKDREYERELDFLERPSTIRWLWILLYIVCGLTLVPELFLDRHAYFGFDGFFGFYALMGFIACAVLILIAKFGGKFLKRTEQYYDR
jgi:uncharacterized membrane protein